MTVELTLDGVAGAIRDAAKERRRKLAGAKPQPRKAERPCDRASIERWRADVAYLEA